MRLIGILDVNKRGKVSAAFLFILVIFILMATVPMIITPMRRPERMFREYILSLTPIGASIYDVIDVIDNRADWGNPGINFELGFAPLSPGRRGPPRDGQPDLPRIGEMSVSAYMGSYRAWYRWFPLFITSVTVFWGFDEDGKLIEVFIWRIGQS